MTVALNRLRGDDAVATLASIGFNPGGETSLFLSPADAQELIEDPANTPWTITEASDLLSGVVTMDTGAETVNLFHDVEMPTSVGTTNGWQVAGFDVYYKVATATLTSADFKLIKTTMAAPPTAAEVTCTGTETLTAGSYALSRTVTTPAVIEENEALRLSLEFVMPNTSVLTYYGTNVRFELVG